MVRFEFKMTYKLHMAAQQKTFFILRNCELCCVLCMNHAFFKELLDCLVFDRFLETVRKIVCDIILRVEAMDVESMAAERVVPEVAMVAEGASPEVSPVQIPAEYQSFHSRLDQGLP